MTMNGLLLFTLLAVGAILLLAADTRWQRVLSDRRAIPAEAASPRAQGIDDAPLMLELLATCLDAGLPLVRALELLATVATDSVSHGLTVAVAGLSIGASWQSSWHPVLHDPPLARLYGSLTFAALTGAASSSLLYAEAAQLRRSSQRAAEKRAAALGVKLVIPLGLCSLPAFICLGVVPVVLALVPSFH